MATHSLLAYSWLFALFLYSGYREIIRALWRAPVGVPLEAFSAKPITLPSVFTGVLHFTSFLFEFGKKRGSVI